MKIQQNWKTLAAVAALTALCAPAQAQWVSLPSTGTPILQTVNPKVALSPQPTSCTNNPSSGAPTGDQIPVETQSSSLATGKFTGLPGTAGMPGYATTPIASATRDIATGSPAVSRGSLYDRVYCKGSGTSTCDGSNVYVFATRVILNTTIANPPSQTYEVNDVFRTIQGAAASGTVEGGYNMGASGTSVDTGLATKYLEYVGRTNNGLNQTIARDNTKVAFRADTNASDPERCEPYSKNSPLSPWLYVRATCPNGVETAAANITFKARVRQGGEESQPVLAVQTSGFVCKP